jgi:hypothetical protein
MALLTSFGLPAWSARKQRNGDDRDRPVADAFDAVGIVRRALANPAVGGLAPLVQALNEVVNGELWRQASSADVDPFPSFGAFAVAELPHGLGIRTCAAARLARQALLDCGHYAAWTEILELIARKPGRPKTRTNGERFEFYAMSRAATSADRLLLALKGGHHDHFARVCKGECSPFRAAIDAGIVSANLPRRLHFGVCDLERVASLRPKVQAKLLRHVFRAAQFDAQCEFIANELQTLGPDLASKWREQSCPR